MATVTTRAWACRIAARAPASSTSFMIHPPWTSPRRLACSGCMSWLSVTREAATVLASIHILLQLARAPGAQHPGFLPQHGDPLERQLGHHRRQRHGRRRTDLGRPWRGKPPLQLGFNGPLAENARIGRQPADVEAQNGVDLAIW